MVVQAVIASLVVVGVTLALFASGKIRAKNHRFNLMGESLRANAKFATSATGEARLKSA